MSTITAGDVTLSPTLVLGYRASRPSRTVTHQVIGKQDPDFSLAPLGRRTGTLSLLFADSVAAWECVDLHSQGGPFTFTDTDRPETSMRYVVTEGAPVEIELHAETQRSWLVHVPFEEAPL